MVFGVASSESVEGLAERRASGRRPDAEQAQAALGGREGLQLARAVGVVLARRAQVPAP
jgi:hypothetical protein